MALKPSEESRSLYPYARKEIELPRSKIRKGMEARRRDRASKRDARPAPEMMIWLLGAHGHGDNVRIKAREGRVIGKSRRIYWGTKLGLIERDIRISCQFKA